MNPVRQWLSTNPTYYDFEAALNSIRSVRASEPDTPPPETNKAWCINSQNKNLPPLLLAPPSIDLGKRKKVLYIVETTVTPLSCPSRGRYSQGHSQSPPDLVRGYTP